MRGAPAPPPAPRLPRRRATSPQHGLLRCLALACALCSLPFRAHCDIIFRVPEVLVRHAAAPRPVGTGSTPLNASRAGTGAGSEQASPDDHYEEYFVEHEVSTGDARKAAAALNLDEMAAPAGCGQCSRREREYCEARVLADHCCCERRFLPEPLPWLPHTCYVGPGRCRPRAKDCARYARLRDCCCRAHLAARWKSILSGSGRMRAAVAATLVPALLLMML